MNSVVSVKKQVQMLKQVLTPKPDDKTVLYMWLPDGDPRHNMTDSELENLHPNSRVVIKPIERFAESKT